MTCIGDVFNDGFIAPGIVGIEDINFVACFTGQGVVTGAASEDVVEGVTGEIVVTGTSSGVFDFIDDDEVEDDDEGDGYEDG